MPYRYYINYYGKLFNNGKYIKNIKEKKYSYSLKVKPKFNFDIWPKIFKKDDTREYRQKVADYGEEFEPDE